MAEIQEIEQTYSPGSRLNSLQEQKIEYYEFDWDNVKSIEDLKTILRSFTSQVVIDQMNPKDVKLYESLKKFLKQAQS